MYICMYVYILIQGNLQVSDQFFAHTLTICSMDPLVFNEIGVLRYLQVCRGVVRGRGLVPRQASGLVLCSDRRAPLSTGRQRFS